ncbi:hypothetical protein [Deinococcus soli (ex Cha et al. 2016)]|uniref:Uncharacterized protein n=2 Tax=Deinococcus soli (ex Cha et al. 2016) TaxID=1309411 RepID=A0AAE3XDT4_9DEIO|nr:hypothetical protein [Deinococcus soli (ex Cha et al. 2016)]MDR6218799.1 hypothetical protein [Deinococcus soli (ex Cha et al. 2016)]MDR6328596.1 hypothetical protein [Deinococcus soli (ex Cha et al. 2016)]MDR6751917.1 hypothetical protein [Deinococcus soli (ex Cha et al. 2016)]
MIRIYFVPDDLWSGALTEQVTLTFPQDYVFVGRFDLPDVASAFPACQNPDWDEPTPPPSWPALLTPPSDARLRSMSVGDLAADDQTGAVMQVRPIGWRLIGHATFSEDGAVTSFTSAP